MQNTNIETRNEVAAEKVKVLKCLSLWSMKFIWSSTEKAAVVYTDSQNVLCILPRLHGVSYPFQAVRKMDFVLERFSRNLRHLDGC